MPHYLPGRVPGYLLRLTVQYERTGKQLERELIRASRIYVEEGVDFDRWNGGMYGHDVFLLVPIEELGKVDIDHQSSLCEGIRDDLRKLSQQVENEYFRQVRLEVADDNDLLFQQAVPFSSRPAVNPDTLAIWEPGLVRLFVSHRDQYKIQANELEGVLRQFGISSFVAHDTIEPTAEWRKVIMSGLETMEAMLVFLTDDFDASTWTNQEVGYALGKGVPIISLKLERKDPPGFISHEQALRGHMEAVASAALDLYPLIAKAVGRADRMQDALVSAFVQSPTYSEAKLRFDRLSQTAKTLTEAQVSDISDGFSRNDQLYQSTYLTSHLDRLRRFLEKATGKFFTIDARLIKEVAIVHPVPQEKDDDIPF